MKKSIEKEATELPMGIPHDFAAEMRALPDPDEHGHYMKEGEKKLAPEDLWIDEIMNRYLEADPRPVEQADAMAREMTRRMRRQRKEHGRWNHSFTDERWRDQVRYLAAAGDLKEGDKAVKELIRLALTRGEATAEMRIGAFEILKQIELSSETLLRLARDAYDVNYWLISHPNADEKVWEMMLERFPYAALRSFLIEQGEAYERSKVVRSEVDEAVRHNCLVAEVYCMHQSGERFRWGFHHLTRRSPIRALRVLDALREEGRNIADYPVSPETMQRLLSVEDSAQRLAAISHGGFVQPMSKEGEQRSASTASGRRSQV